MSQHDDLSPARAILTACGLGLLFWVVAVILLLLMP